MSINQQLSELYSNWRLNHPGHFVTGGVVDEEKFASSKVRVMFLLKEVNDRERKEDWSLVQLIHNQMNKMKFLRIWHTVGIWSFALQNGFPPYQALKLKNNVRGGLCEIATTNLKKSGGGGSSDLKEIREHAKKNKELWVREIEIIQPDIVICGGTFDIIQDILDFETKTCGSGAKIGKALNTTFVDFYHPMYRISPKILYAYFKETMQSLGY